MHRPLPEAGHAGLEVEAEERADARELACGILAEILVPDAMLLGRGDAAQH